MWVVSTVSTSFRSDITLPFQLGLLIRILQIMRTFGDLAHMELHHVCYDFNRAILFLGFENPLMGLTGLFPCVGISYSQRTIPTEGDTTLMAVFIDLPREPLHSHLPPTIR